MYRGGGIRKIRGLQLFYTIRLKDRYGLKLISASGSPKGFWYIYKIHLLPRPLHSRRPVTLSLLAITLSAAAPCFSRCACSFLHPRLWRRSIYAEKLRCWFWLGNRAGCWGNLWTPESEIKGGAFTFFSNSSAVVSALFVAATPPVAATSFSFLTTALLLLLLRGTAGEQALLRRWQQVPVRVVHGRKLRSRVDAGMVGGNVWSDEDCLIATVFFPYFLFFTMGNNDNFLFLFWWKNICGNYYSRQSLSTFLFLSVS